jgi:hypothetical protein
MILMLKFPGGSDQALHFVFVLQACQWGSEKASSMAISDSSN